MNLRIPDERKNNPFKISTQVSHQNKDAKLLYELDKLLKNQFSNIFEIRNSLLNLVSSISYFPEIYLRSSFVIKNIYSLINPNVDESDLFLFLSALKIIIEKSAIAKIQLIYLNPLQLFINLINFQSVRVQLINYEIIKCVCQSEEGSRLIFTSPLFDQIGEMIINLIKFIEQSTEPPNHEINVLCLLFSILKSIVYFQKTEQYVDQILSFVSHIFSSKVRQFLLFDSIEILYFLTTHERKEFRTTIEQKVYQSPAFNYTVALFGSKENKPFFATILNIISEIVTSYDDNIVLNCLDNLNIENYIGLFIENKDDNEICIAILLLLSNIVITSSDLVQPFLCDAFFNALKFVLENCNIEARKNAQLLLWNMLYIGIREQKEAILSQTFILDEFADSFQNDDEDFLEKSLKASFRVLETIRKYGLNDVFPYCKFIEMIVPVIHEFKNYPIKKVAEEAFICMRIFETQ